VAGKHEPDAKGSFYLSLATATLRAGLVIAAVVLGIFVLARAFPGADGDSPQGSPGPIATTDDEESPAPDEEPAENGGEQPPPQEEVNLRGVAVQVQNGTNATGLAAETAEELRELGLRIREIGNAERNYDVTTLFFAQGSRPQAEQLNSQFFDGAAEIDRMPANIQDDIELIVVLGQDYADAQG
jgi:hypothetical protein